MIKFLKNAKYIEGLNTRQRPYGCAHLQKRQLFSQRLHKYSGVVEGMAFRRVRPARAYTTLVMLVLVQFENLQTSLTVRSGKFR